MAAVFRSGGYVGRPWPRAAGGWAASVTTWLEAGSSGAGASSALAVWSGRRPATAVRMAPRLTRCSRARAAMERPCRYAARTLSVFAAATAGRRPPLLPLTSAARSPSYVSSRWRSR
nr:hypothetical protein OG409_37660 [Streptomyces sp. NBC_00974]